MFRPLARRHLAIPQGLLKVDCQTSNAAQLLPQNTPRATAAGAVQQASALSLHQAAVGRGTQADVGDGRLCNASVCSHDSVTYMCAAAHLSQARPLKLVRAARARMQLHAQGHHQRLPNTLRGTLACCSPSAMRSLALTVSSWPRTPFTADSIDCAGLLSVRFCNYCCCCCCYRFFYQLLSLPLPLPLPVLLPACLHQNWRLPEKTVLPHASKSWPPGCAEACASCSTWQRRRLLPPALHSHLGHPTKHFTDLPFAAVLLLLLLLLLRTLLLPHTFSPLCADWQRAARSVAPQLAMTQPPRLATDGGAWPSAWQRATPCGQLRLCLAVWSCHWCGSDAASRAADPSK